MLPRKKVSYFLAVPVLFAAFVFGRTVFAQSYTCHVDTRCTHAVSWCTALTPCNNHGMICWEEFGQCCDGTSGSGETDYCGTDCDSQGSGCGSG